MRDDTEQNCTYPPGIRNWHSFLAPTREYACDNTVNHHKQPWCTVHVYDVHFFSSSRAVRLANPNVCFVLDGQEMMVPNE